MSCLTSFTDDARQDINDADSYLIPIVTEIDDKFHDLMNRVTALENAVLALNAALDLIDQRVVALENR